MINVRLASISNAQNSQTPTPETARLEYSKILAIDQPERVELLAWNPQQDILASSSGDMVSLWDVATGELLSSWQAVPLSLTVAMDWNPEGTLLATADLDGIVQIWDADSGEMTLSFLAPLASDLNWSPDGRLLATANDTEDSSSPGEARVVDLWDSSTGEHLMRLDSSQTAQTNEQSCGESPSSVAFSPDGQQLAVADSIVIVCTWDIETGQIIERLEYNTLSRILGEGWWNQSLDWHGTRIITTSNNNHNNINAVSVWNNDTGELITTLPASGDSGYVSAVDWHSDGQFIAGSTYSGTIQIWDAESYETVAVIQAHDQIIMSVVWSPDGTAIASTGWDGIIRIWNVQLYDISN